MLHYWFKAYSAVKWGFQNGYVLHSGGVASGKRFVTDGDTPSSLKSFYCFIADINLLEFIQFVIIVSVLLDSLLEVNWKTGNEHHRKVLP